MDARPPPVPVVAQKDMSAKTPPSTVSLASDPTKTVRLLELAFGSDSVPRT